MKKVLFFLFLLPIFLSAQSDLETRYLNINATTLPELDDLTTFSLVSTSKFSKKIPTFKMNRENYRQEVNMFEALSTSQQYAPSNIEIKLDPKEYGVFGGNSRYSADGSTEVKNIAYKEARGLYYPDYWPSPYSVTRHSSPFRIYGGYGLYTPQSQ